MPAIAPPLKVFRCCVTAVVLGSAVVDELVGEEAEVEAVCEARASVCVLTIVIPVAIAWRSAGAGAENDTPIGSSQLTLPAAFVPQQRHCWVVALYTASGGPGASE